MPIATKAAVIVRVNTDMRLVLAKLDILIDMSLILSSTHCFGRVSGAAAFMTRRCKTASKLGMQSTSRRLDKGLTNQLCFTCELIDECTVVLEHSVVDLAHDVQIIIAKSRSMREGGLARTMSATLIED